MPRSSPGMTTGKVSRLKANPCLGSSSKSLQQSFDVVELDFRPEALAGPATQLVEDLASLLEGILIRDFNVALIVSAVVGHRPAERVALHPVARQPVGGADLVIAG